MRQQERGPLAERIREARRQVQLTQEGLAEALNVSRQTVKDWEQGVSRPRFENLRGLAQVTGRPVAWFLREDEAPQASSEAPTLADVMAQLRRIYSILARLSKAQEQILRLLRHLVDQGHVLPHPADKVAELQDSQDWRLQPYRERARTLLARASQEEPRLLWPEEIVDLLAARLMEMEESAAD